MNSIGLMSKAKLAVGAVVAASAVGFGFFVQQAANSTAAGSTTPDDAVSSQSTGTSSSAAAPAPPVPVSPGDSNRSSNGGSHGS